VLANYGYEDGSGEYFITVDTDKCDGCGDCAQACPSGVFIIVDEDPYDVLSEEPVAMVVEVHRKRLKETCSPCKPARHRPLLPCVAACKAQALSHSW